MPLEDGTLTVRAKDIGGLTWRELLRALAAYRLPPDVRALKIILPGRGSGPVREIFLSADPFSSGSSVWLIPRVRQ